MAEEQQFCLRWNNFQANITTQFEALRNEEDFVDVTLACDGQRLKAHKVVLSACSPYFKELFRSNPCKHPILFLRDVEFCHLQSLVQFMYAGEVNVAQAQLSSFLRTAESLQIRGLTESPQRHHKGSHGQKRKHLSHNQHHDSSPEDDDDEVLCISSPPSSPPLKNRKNSTEIHDEAYTKQTSNSAVSMEQAIQLAVSGQRDTIHHRQEAESFQEEGPEIFEPKVEVPDYTSDGDSKADNNSMSGSYIGLDNSVDINSSVASLHGGMEILAGSSNQNFIEVSQDLSQGFNVKRRGAAWKGSEIRRRRQLWHRNFHTRDPLATAPVSTSPQSSDCLVPLWVGADACEKKLRAINQWNFKKLTRGLASLLFSQAELATRSVTGQRWARADLEGRPTKPALDSVKVRAIINHVISRFPNVTPSMIKQVLAYKCKESARSNSSC